MADLIYDQDSLVIKANLVSEYHAVLLDMLTQTASLNNAQDIVASPLGMVVIMSGLQQSLLSFERPSEVDILPESFSQHCSHVGNLAGLRVIVDAGDQPDINQYGAGGVIRIPGDEPTNIYLKNIHFC